MTGKFIGALSVLSSGKTIRTQAFAALVAAVIPASQALAGDIVFGLGGDNFDNSSSGAALLELEAHGDPLFTFSGGSASPMGVISVNEDHDTYVGAGLSGLYQLSALWFVEGSLAAGYYGKGSDGQDLGGNLQFRTLLGVGVALSDRSRVSLAVDHLSNAGIEDRNPGRNAVTLRYARSF